MKRWLLPALAVLALTAGCDSPGRESTAASRPAALEQMQTPARAPEEPGHIPADWVPGLEEVATLHLSLGMPVPAEQAPQPLYATHPRHRESIAVLLDILADARLASGEISPPARSQALQVTRRNGRTLSARLAYNCTPFTSETGHGYTCRQAPGEIILHILPGREVRVSNPRLAQWLMGGWKADLPVGPAQLMDRETALEIARMVDAKAPWTATFHGEYPVEGKGGTEVHSAWVVETETPAGSKTRLVIDAHTGEVLRLAQLEPPSS